MANPFDQFDTPSQQGANPFDQFDQVDSKQRQPVQQQPEEAGFIDTVGEMITGSGRQTEQTRTLDEIGSAPELNELSMGAFKASLGLLATGDTDKAKGIIQQNIPGASFTEDEKGNVIANLPSGQYMLNAPGFSPQDLARTIAQFGAFTPAGRATSLAGATGGAALTEAALQQTASELGGGDVDVEDVALAGVLGGAGQAAGDLVSAGYRAARGRIAPESQQLIQAGEEAGIPVMTSDIIEPQTLSGKLARSAGEKMPVVGTGSTRAAQQEARETYVSELADKYGRPDYDTVVKSLRDQSNKVKSAAGSVLQETGAKLDDLGTIEATATTSAIRDAIDEVSKPGVIKSADAKAELEQLLNTLEEAPQTFSTLKENRTAFRDIVNSFGTGQRSQLPTRAKSMLNKVMAGMSKDMDDAARSGLDEREFARWKRANAIYADEAQKLTKTKIKGILDKGDITPEQVETMLLSRKPSEVKTLYESLTTEGRQAARAAMITKAIDNASRRSGGLNPNALATELDKLGPNTKVFFRGQDRAQLEGLKRLLNSTRRAQEAAVETPTGQQLISVLTGAAAITEPLITGTSTALAGAAARLYESPPVRNALLRLASAPKGSTKFDKALSDTVSAIQSASQTIRSQASE